jgi:hypothetical protein
VGDVVNYLSKHFIIKGSMGQYLGFIGEDKYNKSIKKSKLVTKNTGIVYIE